MSETTLAKIEKIDVLTPERVYNGAKEDRWASPRNEGAKIVLHFSDADFPLIKEKIAATPLEGLDPKLHLTGDDEQPGSYSDDPPVELLPIFKSLLGANISDIPRTATTSRDEAKSKWQTMHQNAATLFHSDGQILQGADPDDGLSDPIKSVYSDKFVVNAEIGSEPNSIIIYKIQHEPETDELGYVSGNNQDGSEGTRAMHANDIARLSNALENALGIEVTSTIVNELGNGLEHAQPKRNNAEPDTRSIDRKADKILGILTHELNTDDNSAAATLSRSEMRGLRMKSGRLQREREKLGGDIPGTSHCVTFLR